MGKSASSLLLLCFLAVPVVAAEPVDLDMVNQIRQEAFHHSQVMELLEHLTEDIGPRLTGSPQLASAHAWTAQTFREWGLANVHAEAYADFGRGWEFGHAHLDLLAPRATSLHALPEAWTPGTDGPVEGEVLAVHVEQAEDLEQYAGKLAGKILLLDAARAHERAPGPAAQRHDDASLAALHDWDIPLGADDTWKQEYIKSRELGRVMREFFAAEGALATLSISSRDNGIVRVTGGGSRKAGEEVGVPSLVVAAEHYNMLVRLAQRDAPPRLRLDVQAGFVDSEDQPGWNTLAEIPGRGRKAGEVVMLGAHLDSWHAGTGAADNGAGVAVMMEAMRILKAVGARPERTIRVALWTGEEQGLIGSRAYVSEHFARYPEPADPEQKKLPDFLRERTGPLEKLEGWDRLAAYFNVDNGSGRLRGIYAQENVAVMPIFQAWLEPFADVGATSVVSRNTGGTDHMSFDRVGLPGFQFIQDRLDYFTHVHHTDLDTLDHVEEADLKQAAAVVAAFAWHAATRAEKLPRKPPPRND